MAQETRGTIFGTISDPNRRAVAGASVRVKNVDMNVASDVKTNESINS